MLAKVQLVGFSPDPLAKLPFWIRLVGLPVVVFVSETFENEMNAGSSRKAKVMFVFATAATKLTVSVTAAPWLTLCAAVPVSPPPRSRIEPAGGELFMPRARAGPAASIAAAATTPYNVLVMFGLRYYFYENTNIKF